MNRTLLIFCFGLFSLYFSSCRPVSLIQRINSETAEAVQFSHHNKQVSFIPMHHIGKPLFYVNVRLLVDSFKKLGYIVFYESAKPDEIEDSLIRDGYQRKLRKMLGVYLDSTGYAKHLPQTPMFRELINQPSYVELGLGDTDLRVDIPNNKLVDAYEAKFGPIVLSTEDYETALGNRYQPWLRLPKKNVMEIIIDHRDKNLAAAIQNSAHPKILVIYGALHLDGTFEELKGMDKAWSRSKKKVRKAAKLNRE